MEMNFKPLLGRDVEIVFLLIQGKVMGLVKQTMKEEVAPQRQGLSPKRVRKG